MSYPTIYSTRSVLPEELVQNQANTIVCPIYLEGELIVPSSATVDIVSPSGQTLLSASATITNSVATYTIGSSVFTSQVLSEGWQIIWSITHSGGQDTIERSAILVRRKLYPTLIDADLYQRHPLLQPGRNSIYSSDGTQNHQTSINEAWVEICTRLNNLGRRPYLISDSSALRNPHLYLTLSIIYQYLASPSNTDYQTLSDKYREMYNTAFTEMKLQYDSNNDGRPDVKVPGPTMIRLKAR